MKRQTVRNMRTGYTLIELIIVIAILAIISMVGIHSYSNLKEIQAKKLNVSNLKRLNHTLSTYDAIKENDYTKFNNFDSLLDVTPSGRWLGTAGSYSWTGETDVYTALNGSGGGVYDGSWKALRATYNAAGQGSGTVASIEEAKEKNRGIRETGIYGMLSVYYLQENTTSKEVTALRNAGIQRVLLHNPSTAQASGSKRGGYAASVVDDNSNMNVEGYRCVNGGPGFRPDLSAFYPTALTNGSPVVIIDPRKGSTIYADLGYEISYTNTTISIANMTTAEAKTIADSTKLLVFGIGLAGECVRSQVGLGEPPYKGTYGSNTYRFYYAIFALKAGGQGVAKSCHFAGVLDCDGKTYRAASYDVDWTTQLN